MKYSILLFFGLLFSTSLIAQDINKLTRLYSKKNYEKVIEQGIKDLETNPFHPQVNMLVGRAYTDNQQFEKAIPYLEKGTITEYNVGWVQAWSFKYLGTCYYFLNNLQKSKDYLNKCINLNATENSKKEAQYLLKVTQIDEFYDNWEVVESDNFRFHFQTPCPISDKDNFIKEREQAYSKVNEFFNAKPIKKIDFFVWNDPQQASKIFGRELGFAEPWICVINSRINQTTGHEITHILSYYGIKPIIRTGLINEGIGVYFDQSKKDYFANAKRAIEGKELSIVDLWENPKNYSYDLNYPIGGALIAYLFEKGTEKQIRDLMKDQSIASARKIYKDFDELINDFTKRINEK